MHFIKTLLNGVFTIELDRKTDERGFFARSFCLDEFKENGIDFRIVQCNTSFNKTKGTVRGMHYQAYPWAEAKVVKCNKGSIYDVVLDMRPGSLTYGQWIHIHLSDRNFRMVYIPKGCAHGYQTLAHNTVVNYMVTEPYMPKYSTTVPYKQHYISWPLPITKISEKDAAE
jgi:dTDP-4-dehydrorhamnose 3,5-epimerase